MTLPHPHRPAPLLLVVLTAACSARPEDTRSPSGDSGAFTPEGYVELSAGDSVLGGVTSAVGTDLAFLASGELLLGAPSIVTCCDDGGSDDRAYLLQAPASGELGKDVWVVPVDDHRSEAGRVWWFPRAGL